MKTYSYEDVVVTNNNEVMYYGKIPENQKDIVVRIATAEEASEYISEYEYWEREESSNIASSYYCYPPIYE